MTLLLLLELLILVGLLGFSAFFSGSETALFSLDRVAVEKLKQTHPPRGDTIFRLLRDPPRLLISIVLGNTLVNILASTLAERVSAQLLPGALTWIISAVVMTFLILILGEIVPKTLAISRAPGASLKVAPAISLLDKLLSPLRVVVVAINHLIVGKLPERSPEAPVTKEELATAIRVGGKEGTLNGGALSVITDIFKLGDKTVHQLMTPRNEIVSFEVNTPLDDLYEAIKEKEYSRIPIFAGKKENVIGILYPKDLVIARSRGIEDIKPGNFLRKPYFVPETMKASRLLQQFLQRKIHIALVVDEYGGLSGLITLDDLIEEIVGEIREKGETTPSYEVLGDNSIKIKGRVELDFINEEFCLNLSSNENVTLGGYLCGVTGRIPPPGEIWREGELEFKVLNLKQNRVGEVIIKKPGIGRRMEGEKE